MDKFVKKAYVISAEFAPNGVEVYNFLEDCHYVTSPEKPVILTGTAGEQWVVTAEKLAKTYLLESGAEINVEALPDGQFRVRTKTDGSEVIHAERVTDQRKVATSWGEILTANREGVPHGAGDYVVYADKNGAPDLEDSWVVNGLIFPATYQQV